LRRGGSEGWKSLSCKKREAEEERGVVGSYGKHMNVSKVLKGGEVEKPSIEEKNRNSTKRFNREKAPQAGGMGEGSEGGKRKKFEEKQTRKISTPRAQGSTFYW